MSTAVARPVSPPSLAPLVGILLLLAVVAAAFCAIQTYRHYEAAVAKHGWLRWAGSERAVSDYFRFAFSSADEVATALAPAAVSGIDAIPLTFGPDPSETAGTDLVQSLNDINPACAQSPVALAPCGEAAVATRHARLEHALGATPLASDYWIERKGVEMRFLQLLALNVNVCGLTPYQTQTALMVKPVDGYGKAGVTGWLDRAPGQCASLNLGKYRHAPKVLAHTRGADAVALGLLREDGTYAASWNGQPVAWGSDEPGSERACVGTGSALARPDCGFFSQPVGFRAVEMKLAPGEANGRWLITDPGLCAADCVWEHSRDDIPVEALQRHAEQLASLLPLRKAYRAQYGGERPYILGVGVSDSNGAYRAGVEIVDAPALTPLGVQSPFRNGDVITELAGMPIFSVEDIGLALERFIVSTGADNTYRYQYWRPDPATGVMGKAEGSGTAHFDAAYWISHGYSGSQVSALMHGLLNSLSFGLYRSVGCFFKRAFAVVPSYTECKIAAANEWMLLRQLYPDWYAWGALPSMIFSPIRMILSVSGVAVSASASLAIELLESGMSVAADRLPGEAISISAGQVVRSVVIGRVAAFASPLNRRR